MYISRNIHTQPEDGHWKFQGEGVLEAKIFKGKYVTKLEFLEGWGLKRENLLWDRYGCFLEQHNTMVLLAHALRKQKKFL